jgi:hypothetical protein
MRWKGRRRLVSGLIDRNLGLWTKVDYLVNLIELNLKAKRFGRF